MSYIELDLQLAMLIVWIHFFCFCSVILFLLLLLLSRFFISCIIDAHLMMTEGEINIQLDLTCLVSNENSIPTFIFFVLYLQLHSICSSDLTIKSDRHTTKRYECYHFNEIDFYKFVVLFSFNVCVKAIFFCLAFRHGVSVQAMESFYTLESGLLKAIMVGERQGLGARNRDQLLDTN